MADGYGSDMLRPSSSVYKCEDFGGPRRLEALAQRRQGADAGEVPHGRIEEGGCGKRSNTEVKQLLVQKGFGD